MFGIYIQLRNEWLSGFRVSKAGNIEPTFVPHTNKSFAPQGILKFETEDRAEKLIMSPVLENYCARAVVVKV